MKSHTIVIGGGIDGLAAAASSARAGIQTTLIDAGDCLGGQARATEFHPGFRLPGLCPATDWVRPELLKQLGLQDFGLEFRQAPQAVYMPEAGGAGLVVSPGDLCNSTSGIEQALAQRCPADIKTWLELRTLLGKLRPLLERALDRVPPTALDPKLADLAELGRSAFGLRRLGTRDMVESLRILSQPVWDLCEEYFEDKLVQAWMASLGIELSYMGPRAPYSAAGLSLRLGTAGPGLKGGAGALVQALEACCNKAGVQILQGSKVAAITVEGGRVQGVQLESGDSLQASCVLSTAAPQTTLLELLPATALPGRLSAGADNMRARGSLACMQLALSKPFPWSAERGSRAGVTRARILSDMTGLERCFDDVVQRRLPTRPWFDVIEASAEDPQSAPEGAASVLVRIPCAVHELDGGWTSAAKEELKERVLQQLEPHTSGLRDSILACHVQSPPELADSYHLPGGHPLHLEAALDQIWFSRPCAALGQYATPIDGLFLGGRGSHPGLEFCGSSGLLAAERSRR